MVIDRAVIAPVVPAGPVVLTHTPLASCAAVAELVVVMATDPPTVTFTEPVTSCGRLRDMDALVVFGTVAFTVTMSPFTAVTDPAASPEVPEVPEVPEAPGPPTVAGEGGRGR